MNKQTSFPALLASAIFMTLAVPAQSAPITIFNTGVNAGGVSQADNAAELHYLLIAPSPTVGVPLVATSAGGFPIGPWLSDSAISAWISPTANTIDAVGTYIYRTTFDLTGLDPTTATLNGRWSSDDNGLDILINGVSTGQTVPGSGFASWFAFGVTSGFTATVNTLDFVLTNGGGPTGLRVEVQGSATAINGAVPEPGSLALVGCGLLGLVGLGVMRRRKDHGFDAASI